MEIKGKTALVSGGASGLGEAAVRMVVEEGGNAVIVDINEEKGSRLVAEMGDRVVFVKTDVTNEDDVNSAINIVRERFDAVHFLINCAGSGIAVRTVSKKGPHDLNSFQWLINLNLIGTFNTASKAAFEMTKNETDENGERGVIINIASTAAFEGQVGQAAYSASKAGVVGMTLPMARDLASLGIRIMTIAPGLFLTPLTKLLPDEKLEGLNDLVPFPKRMGKTEEFSALVRDIIKNPYLNGETIRLDGALRMNQK